MGLPVPTPADDAALHKVLEQPVIRTGDGRCTLTPDGMSWDDEIIPNRFELQAGTVGVDIPGRAEKLPGQEALEKALAGSTLLSVRSETTPKDTLGAAPSDVSKIEDDPRVAAVMDALRAPERLVGPVCAFPTDDQLLRWQARAVLVALRLHSLALAAELDEHRRSA